MCAPQEDFERRQVDTCRHVLPPTHEDSKQRIASWESARLGHSKSAMQEVMDVAWALCKFLDRCARDGHSPVPGCPLVVGQEALQRPSERLKLEAISLCTASGSSSEY